MNGYVYILQSLVNNRFYIGSTKNLQKRVEEHNKGKSKYTKLTRPFKLVFSQKYTTLLGAQKIELWLKKQKDRDIILRIIEEGIIKKVV